MKSKKVWNAGLSMMLACMMGIGLVSMPLYAETGTETAIETVTAIAALEKTVYTVANGTDVTELGLPRTISATVSTQGAAETDPVTTRQDDLQVIWTGAYDASVAGSYVFASAFAEEVTIAEGVRMPEVTVTVEAAAAEAPEISTLENNANLVFPYKDQTMEGESSYDITPTCTNCTISNGELIYNASLTQYNLQFSADDDLTSTWEAFDNFLGQMVSQENITNFQLFAPYGEDLMFNIKLDSRLKVDMEKYTLAAAQAQFAADNPEWDPYLGIIWVGYNQTENKITMQARFKNNKVSGTVSYNDAFEYMTAKPSTRMIWKTPIDAIYLPSSAYEQLTDTDTVEVKGCIAQNLYYVQLRSYNPTVDAAIPEFMNNTWFPGSTVTRDDWNVIMQNITINCPADAANVSLKRHIDKPTPEPEVEDKGRTCQDDGFPAGYYWNGTACVIDKVYKVPNTGDR